MAAPKQKRPKVDDYIEEIEARIKSKFPEAEFEVVPLSRKEMMLRVDGDFRNIFDVLDLVADRTTDILVETGIDIHVVPLKRDAAKA